MKDRAYLPDSQVDGTGLLGNAVNMLKGTAKFHLQVSTAHANSCRDFRHAQGAGHEPKHRKWVHSVELAPLEA